ncbi:hypothetical protein GFK91_30730 (plasmid) [Roseibium aggregatum]|uniref:hypothetical protein n=1 Tax=Roseibium aggregatum TaxID=187304 RepID=UPI001E5E8BB0|nr:hypothetical protein [Roseibium aggregatum]UES60115.1 hypothetical protein GFK91_30730 [Roseibium aggregatum]
MQTIIYDDKGRARDAKSPSLQYEFYGTACDFDLTSYLLDNLGFAELRWRNAGAAIVRFRPSVVSAAAVAAVLFAIWDRMPRRVVVSSREPDGDDSFCSGPADAAAYIGDLLSDVTRKTTKPFLSRLLSIGGDGDANDPLSTLLRTWSQSSGAFCPDDHRDFLQRGLKDRFMIVDVRANRRLHISAVGKGFQAYGAAWRENAAGLPLENQPDYAYGEWVRDMFDSVLASRCPRLDEVDAMLRRPHLNDRIRSRYRRLILPFRDGASGHVRLLGVSVVDETIDLRKKPGLSSA